MDDVPAAGVKMAMGTDAGGFGHGQNASELTYLVEAGMTPMQIITAATKNGACSCNMENELGTLEAGKLADVLVVDGDPLADIHVLTNAHLILREGKAI